MYNIKKDVILMKELSDALAYYHWVEANINEYIDKEHRFELLAKLREDTLKRIEQIIND